MNDKLKFDDFFIVFVVSEQMNEKFRKSDLTLTQTLDQYDVSMMMDDDLAKMNSILYSNVLCLSNNQPTVELQFSK